MKILSLILLLLVSTNVFSEWTAVDSNNEMTTYYVDFDTIKRKGNKVKMWRLLDFKTAPEIGSDRFLSSMNRDEYDCEEETSRRLDSFKYSGNMKSGEIVYSQKNIKEEAESIIPGSVSKFFFNIACDK
jgi:hypothetical protein